MASQLEPQKDSKGRSKEGNRGDCKEDNKDEKVGEVVVGLEGVWY